MSKVIWRCMALVLACSALQAQAHRAWIVPTSTVLSGDEAWVSIDAAISNQIFHADHQPMALAAITVQAPDKSALVLENAQKGKLRSTFDVHLTQKGSYRIATSSQGLMASWLNKDGQRQSWPARGRIVNSSDFAKEVPKKAKELSVIQRSRRVETFVTLGSPSKDVLAISGQGLELLPLTHPNDLYVGEAAQFQLFIDGMPAAEAKIEIFAAGMRYRDAQEGITLHSDAQGKFSVTWPEAGLYWLEANYRDAQAKKPAMLRQGSYAATFEVMPE